MKEIGRKQQGKMGQSGQIVEKFCFWGPKMVGVKFCRIGKLRVVLGLIPASYLFAGTYELARRGTLDEAGVWV